MSDFYKIKNGHFWNKNKDNGLILFSEVCCLQCSGSYTICYVFDGRVFKVTYCLGKVITKMNTTGFMRTHESFYAGFKHVLHMEKRKDEYDGSYILYPNNIEIKCRHELEKTFESSWLNYLLDQKMNGHK